MESSKNYSSSNETNSKHRSISDKQSEIENASLSFSEINKIRGGNLERNIIEALIFYEKTSLAYKKKVTTSRKSTQ